MDGRDEPGHDDDLIPPPALALGSRRAELALGVAGRRPVGWGVPPQASRQRPKLDAAALLWPLPAADFHLQLEAQFRQISDLQNFLLTPAPNHLHIPARPAPLRGALRNVTKRGAGCGGRGWRCRRRRPMRTEKSRGPDAPTLASSLREAASAGDGGKKARSPGRSRINRKTIARGMPGDSGVT